jgi:hypothetical protein
VLRKQLRLFHDVLVRKTACGGPGTLLVYVLFGRCRDENWTCLCIQLTMTPASLVSRRLSRLLCLSQFPGAAEMLSTDCKS